MSKEETKSKFKLIPFKKIAGLSKDKLREMMATPRAARLKAQANMEMADLDMEIQKLQAQVEESFANEDSYKNFDFKGLLEKLDDIAILENRREQYEEVLKQLFPENETDEPEEKSDAA